jgi:flagellar biosynthesis protein FlhB
MGEKTEQPTAKRLRDSRKKGQVARSNDFTQAFLFLTAAGVLSAGGAYYVAELLKLVHDSFRPEQLTGELSTEQILHLMGSAWTRFLLLSIPLLGALMLAAAAVSFLQVKFAFTPEVIKPKLDKLNPIKGFQNLLFKSRTYLELIKNLVKFAIVLWILYSTIRLFLRDVLLSVRTDPFNAGVLASSMMFTLLFKVGGVFLVLGAADFMLQKKMHLKGLMMTKDEVHREYKEDEGDPHIKHMRKHIHEEMINSSAVHNVPKAHVVVVNPTHLAIAIQYDEASMAAPRVIAKGADQMAKQIIKLAKQHGKPVIRNVPLARQLFEVDLGEDIPEDLYEAVAEVLNWVYQLANSGSF